jgi:allantoin racemase
MKTLIINPNSDQEMTELILESGKSFTADSDIVECIPTPGAPKFIETYEDQVKAAPGMIQIVRENEDKYDAFIVACHCDPNLDVLKEITTKPVVGIGEASMQIAAMLGHKFSVISTSPHSIPIKEELIRKYHLQDFLASVKAPSDRLTDADEEAKYLETARAAITEDGAEVIVLGCAGLSGMDKRLQKQLNIPILDGVVCALIFATGFVRYGVSTSKACRYNPNLK